MTTTRDLVLLAATALATGCTAPPATVRGGDAARVPANAGAPTSAVKQAPGQPAGVAAPGPARAWEFVIQPYLLFASIDGTAGVGRAGDVPVDVPFGDILDSMQAGGMVHAEARHDGGFGLWLDYAFMDLGSDRPSVSGTVLDAGVRQGVLEAFVTHRHRYLNGAIVDVFAGARWWDIDLDLTLAPTSLRRDRSADWIDPVVGVRARQPFDADWGLITRWDMGGFGIASDFTWTASLGVERRIGSSIAIELDYKALSVDYDEARGTPDYFRYDTITHGPQLGFSITF